jgi:hypothetical protein
MNILNDYIDNALKIYFEKENKEEQFANHIKFSSYHTGHTFSLSDSNRYKEKIKPRLTLSEICQAKRRTSQFLV